MTAPNQKAAELVIRGLEHYGAGQLREAIGEWERALALTPGNREARDYLTYVRKNYDALRSQFDDSGSLSLSDFSLVNAGGAKLSFKEPSAEGGEHRWDVDGGWSFSESPLQGMPGDRVGPTPRTTMDLGSGVLGELPEIGLADAGDGIEPGAGVLELEPVAGESVESGEAQARTGTLDLSELSLAESSPADDQAVTVQRRLPIDFSDISLAGDDDDQVPAGDDDEPATVQRASPLDLADISLPGDDVAEVETVQRPNPIDFSGLELATPGQAIELDEVRMDQEATEQFTAPVPEGESKRPKFLAEPPPTVELRPPSLSRARTESQLPSGERLDRAETVETPEGLSLPEPDRPTTEVALKAADGSTLTPMEALRRDLSQAADEGAPAGEDPDAIVKRRVSRLIERSLSEMTRGRGQLAVVAANLALDEAPASVVAQKLIHGHKDDLRGVFISYVGTTDRVPVLSRPLTELSSGIDSRDAFLLTQVDGLLSFADIVDVSGMPPLNAYRIICRLLIDGIILVS